MNSMNLASIGLVAALAAVLPAIPAHATQLTRTFVSAAGSNSNPCTITAPCASFQTAYSLTAPNGIVTALDPGKYGPVAIIGPVTINGNGWAAITAPATGSGVTVNAGIHDNVALTGLNIDGAAAAYNGVVFTSGASLTVTNCVLQNFYLNGTATGNGILIAPTSGTVEFAITNTTVANNAGDGIQYNPPSGSPVAQGVIDHVVAIANQNIGIRLESAGATGGSLVATISNSIASNDGTAGIRAFNGTATLKLSIDDVTVSGDGEGIEAFNTVQVLLGRSAVTGNSVGINNSTLPNSFFTFQNNQIGLNGSDISGASLINKGFQ